MFRGRIRAIHFVGVGGVGMSGIAEVLLDAGFQVSGSDLRQNEYTRRLLDKGAKVAMGHAAEHVDEADVVVFSSAVPRTNPELVEARARAIPVIPRAEMLGELMRLKDGIAIAGSHGKTTTTSLVATVLRDAGLDPTVVIGGRLNSLGSGAASGRGNLLVAEADESDGSFLHLTPAIAAITNIDPEHLDHYGDLAGVQDAFVAFANRVPFYGLVVCCLDNANLQQILPRIDNESPPTVSPPKRTTERETPILTVLAFTLASPAGGRPGRVRGAHAGHAQRDERVGDHRHRRRARR